MTSPDSAEEHGNATLTVLVLGMHRSGTSAVAGVLQAAGLFGGDEGGFMAPTPDNPAGYWERERLRLFNDRLLASLDWGWDTPPALPPPVPPPRAGFVEEGRRLVREIIARPTATFIKDPRISLLLPWWRQMLLDRLVAIVVLRDPDEVAWSVSVRDGLAPPLGHALWGAYHRHLVKGLEGLPVVIVSYSHLVADPGSVVPDLLRQLEQFGVSVGDREEAATAAIRPELRRATQPGGSTGASQAPPGIPPGVQAWLEAPITRLERFASEIDGPAPWESALLELHRGAREEQGRTAVAMTTIDRVSAEAEAARADAMIATDGRRAYSERASTLEDERDELQATVGDLRSEGETLRAERDELRHGTERLRVDGNALKAQLTQIRADGDALRAQATELMTERDELRREIDRLRTDGDALRAQATELMTERDELRREIDRLRTDGDALRAQARELVAQRDELALRPTGTQGSVKQDFARPEASAGRRSAPVGRWIRRPLRGLWLLVTLRLWRHLRTNHLFDAEWYLAQYPDVRDGGMDPREHYRSLGATEGRNPNPMFDTAWYLEQNPDVVESGLNALDHYWFFGAAEGRDPSPRFDTAWYVSQNPDVAAGKTNPLLHYLRYGALELRPPRPKADAASPPSGSDAAAEPLRRI